MTYEALFAETVLMRGHQGDQIDAYFARPVGAGPYGGVVIIHVEIALAAHRCVESGVTHECRQEVIQESDAGRNLGLTPAVECQ